MAAGIPTDEIAVLFVDDEQAVLDGIARMLRRLHPRWRVQYTTSPIEALEIYRRDVQTLDVVVCDINMPQITGVQIMQAIHAHTPHIGRITLSGQLDGATLVGVGKHVHHHLCKPVDPDVLCEAIVRLYLARRAAVAG
jgi:two-component system OmpR family response regulator